MAPGIAPEHIAKIFDPFFTTKESGSGLGLATSYSIIKKHEGYVQRGQRPWRGEHFPHLSSRLSETVRRRRRRREQQGTIGSFAFPPTRALRVLIMDDEAAVSELAQAMLMHLGHQTVGVTDGTKAIKAYRRACDEGHPFDVVILDLTVPGGMGGRDALDQLRKIDPRVMAVVSSGYSNNPIMSDHGSHGFRGVFPNLTGSTSWRTSCTNYSRCRRRF